MTKMNTRDWDQRLSSKAGNHVKVGPHPNTWKNRYHFDWNEKQVERLVKMMENGMSAGMIAKEFSTKEFELTRNAVIGKVLRLQEKGIITIGWTKKPVKRNATPRPPRDKQFRIKSKAPNTDPKAVMRINNEGQPEMMAAREIRTPDDLAAYNAERVPHAKSIIEYTGCKFPVCDDPYLMCDEVKEGPTYCHIHLQWVTQRPTPPNERKPVPVSPWRGKIDRY